MNQDTVINNRFITGDFKVMGSKFATNYGDSLSILHTSLYMYGSNLTVLRVDSTDFSFIGARIYQVSESIKDTLIIEGWLNNKLKYSTVISDNSAWSTCLLYWAIVDKVVFKAKLNLDYNIDNLFLISKR